MPGSLRAGLVLGALLSACHAGTAIELPNSDAATMFLVDLDGEGIPVRLSVVRLQAGGQPSAASRTDSEATYVILTPHTLDELQLDPGPLPLSPDPRRTLPSEVTAFAAMGDHLEPLSAPETKKLRETIHLPMLDALLCLDHKGCLSGKEVGDLCLSSCEHADIEAPILAAAPMPPEVELPSCVGAARGFLIAPFCRPPPVCPTEWPSASPGSIYADATASGGDGSMAAPFGSLQAAIDACPEGEEVLARGTFMQSVEVRARRAIVRGVCPSEARIVASSSVAITVSDGGFLELRSLEISATGWGIVTQSSTTVGRELSFVGQGGALSAASSSVTIDTMSLAASSSAAISMDRSAVTLFASNLEIESGRGIRVGGASRLAARGLWLRALGEAQRGIDVGPGAELDVVGAIVAGNFDSAITADRALGVRVVDTRVLGAHGNGIAVRSTPTALARLEIGNISTSLVDPMQGVSGIAAVYSSLRAEDVWVHEVAGGAVPRPAGIRCLQGVSARLVRARIAEVEFGVVLSSHDNDVQRSELAYAADLYIEQTRTALLTDFSKLDPTRLVLRRVEVRRTDKDGVDLNRFTISDIEDLSIEDTSGSGMTLQVDFPQILRRVAVRRSTGFGIEVQASQFAALNPITQRLEHLVIEDVVLAAQDQVGLRVQKGHVELEHFRISGGSMGLSTGGAEGSHFFDGQIERQTVTGLQAESDVDLDFLRQVSFSANRRDVSFGRVE